MQLHRLLLPAKPSSTAMPAFYRIRDVTRICALSRSTIYRRIADGTFPAQVRLGPRASAWSSAALQAWIDNPEGYRVERTQE
jgi:prophage regulatory protein